MGWVTLTRGVGDRGDEHCHERYLCRRSRLMSAFHAYVRALEVDDTEVLARRELLRESGVIARVWWCLKKGVGVCVVVRMPFVVPSASISPYVVVVFVCLV